MENLEIFERKGKADPDIIGRCVVRFDKISPMRVYFHDCCFKEAYGNFDSAESHLDALFTYYSSLAKSADYFLPIMWGNNKKRMVNLFAYSGLKDNWNENPNVTAYVMENGFYTPNNREISCGDGMIILGIEEKHRRTTRCLEEYIKIPPVIEGLVKK